MLWYSHLFQNFAQFIVIHTVKGFGIVNKADIAVFLELSCFFNDSMDVANLISGSSAFSKSSLNIWNFTVHVLLRPGMENFEHYFTSGCQEPAREFPPMTRSCGRGLTGKVSQGSRGPWICLSIYPKTRICLFYYFTTFTNSSDIKGGYPQPPFSEGNKLRALVNKPPGHNKSVSIQTPQMALELA